MGTGSERCSGSPTLEQPEWLQTNKTDKMGSYKQTRTRGLNVRGRRAAAPADNAGSGLKQACGSIGKDVGRDAVLPVSLVVLLRQSGVGLHQQGKRGNAAHSGREFRKSIGRNAAVRPHNVHARLFQRLRHSFGTCFPSGITFIWPRNGTLRPAEEGVMPSNW